MSKKFLSNFEQPEEVQETSSNFNKSKVIDERKIEVLIEDLDNEILKFQNILNDLKNKPQQEKKGKEEKQGKQEKVVNEQVVSSNTDYEEVEVSLENNLENRLFKIESLQKNIKDIKEALEQMKPTVFGGQSKKHQERLQRKLAKEEELLEIEKQELLKEQIGFFVDNKEEEIETEFSQIAEGENVADYYKAWAYLEKNMSGKMISEKWKNKLNKQGFWGKHLGNEGRLDKVVDFQLLGGAFAIGSKSVQTASMVPDNLVWDLDINGSNDLLKWSQNSWAEAHGWDQKIDYKEVDNKDISEILSYVLHYEGNSLLKGQSIDQDDHYQKIVNILTDKIDKKYSQEKETVAKTEEFLNNQENSINQELDKLLAKKLSEKNAVDVYSTTLWLLVESGYFQELIDQALLKDKVEKFNLDQTITEQFLEDGVTLKNDNLDLLAEEEYLSFDTENQEISFDLDKFLQDHRLLSKENIEIIPMEKEIKLKMLVGPNEDFSLKQEALRTLVMDVFPENKILDADGFSVRDAASIEKTVYMFKEYLESDNEKLEHVIKWNGAHLVIEDYQHFYDLAEKVLRDNFQTLESNDKFIKIGKEIDPEIWSSLLEGKLFK